MRASYLSTYLLLFALSLSSCNTFSTFYSNTEISDEVKKNSKRAVLFGGDDVLLKRVDGLRMLCIKEAGLGQVERILAKVQHPEKLKVLKLDSLNLVYLPKNIKRFSRLEQLSLRYNPNLNLQDAVENISKLPLQFLDLSHNKITMLPKNLSQLQTLEDLNLSFNKVHKGENYKLLAALKKLRLLWLDGNEIKKLPKEIGELTQLERLFLDYNQLVVFPTEMQEMNKLRVLHLGYNKLKEYPEVFYKMKMLILLHLNNNNIENLSEAYKKKKINVKGIVLDGNPFSKEEKEWVRKNFAPFFLLSI